jgi:hypothetical protein
MSKRKKENISKKYKILILVAIILSLVLEFIFVNSKVFTSLSIGRVITVFAVITFLGLHFVMGFKKLYTFIVEHRYILSGILIVLSTIVGFFQNNMTIKEWILTTDIVLSLWWNIKFFSILLVSYELFYIITNENRNMSIIGSIVVTFSGAVQLNFGYICGSLIIGELIVVLVNKLLVSEKNTNTYLIALGIILASYFYAFTFKSYTISFGYIFLALIIWILLKNKEKLKDKQLRLVCIVTLILSIISAFVSNKLFGVFNNDLSFEETSGFAYLFSYLYNFLLPFNNIENKALFGNFISIFPIPMIVSLYYIYKKEKHIEFLLPITIVTVLETVFCLSGFPDSIEKITKFNLVNTARCSMAVGLANVYILFYMLGNIEERIFSLKSAITLTIITVCIVAFVPLPIAFSAKKYIYILAAEMCVLALLYYNFGDIRYKKVILGFLVLLTLISGVFVNPIINEKNKTITSEKITYEQN